MCSKINPCNVLFVEDEPSLLQLISMQESHLLERGVKALYARTFVEAEDVLSKQDVVIVILDLGLDDSKGLKTLERVYDLVREKGTPIYVYTGDNNLSLHKQVIAAGAREVFYKNDMPILNMLTFSHHAANEQRKTQTLKQEREYWKTKAETIENELNALKDFIVNIRPETPRTERMKRLEKAGERIEKIHSLVATR
jgi:DNA-binding NtrC family response regulator